MNGKKIPVYGTRLVTLVFDTEQGHETSITITFYVTDIQLVVISLTSLVENDNFSVTMKPNAWTLVKSTHETTPMRIVNGLPWLIPKKFGKTATQVAMMTNPSKDTPSHKQDH